MNLEVDFHPAAEQELLDAEGWYAERSLIAARAFVQEVTHVVERARAAPERWPIHLHVPDAAVRPPQLTRCPPCGKRFPNDGVGCPRTSGFFLAGPLTKWLRTYA